MYTEHVIAYIGLGSNLGDRAGNLLLGIRGLMEASFEVTKLSAIYETEPVGIDNAPNFLNMVAEVRTVSITASQMMARMLRIEYILGRRDKNLNRPRTIDLDLLFFGDQKVDTPFLVLPHPRLHLRNFVLIPMSEIAPHFIHPRSKRSIETLLAESTDRSHVSRWHPNDHNELRDSQSG